MKECILPKGFSGESSKARRKRKKLEAKGIKKMPEREQGSLDAWTDIILGDRNTKPHSDVGSGGSNRRKSNSVGEPRDRRIGNMSDKKTYEIDVGAKGTKQDARRKARAKARDAGHVFKVRSVKKHDKKKNIFVVSGDIRTRKISDKKGKKTKKAAKKGSSKKGTKKTTKKKAVVKKKDKK